jgi:general secretion pathway protein K
MAPLPATTCRRPRRNRGVALITALLIGALGAMVATDLAWDNALDVRRTMSMLYRDQAMQIALGAESWVIGILHQDLEDSQTDHLGEIWAQELPGLPIEGGEVFGQVTDLQGRFNVNSLIDDQGQAVPGSVEQFRRLLAALELDPRIAGVTADWLDADQTAQFPDGAEDPIYTAILPPYRTANRMLTSISELAALDGMDKAAFDVLAPHIAALPGRTAINVNTATPAVLQSLGDNLTAGDIEALLPEREDGGFTDIETAFSSLVAPDVLNSLDEATNYFQLRVVVRIGTVRVTLYSVLQRSPDGSVTPILRSFGTV